MIAGADSIDDMGLLRHGAMPPCSAAIRAPSTLGSFLRSFTWGNVLQLQKVHREFLAELARRAPLLPGADVLAFVDIDSQQKRVYGHAKQGAAFGFTKIQGKGLLVRGLNVLAASDLHAAGRPGDRRHEAARRQRHLRPRRRLDDHRGSGDRPAGRVHRHAGRADGLGVLRLPGRRGGPPRRGAFLRHRPHGPQGPRRDRRHRRRRLDADPLSPRHLG